MLAVFSTLGYTNVQLLKNKSYTHRILDFYTFKNSPLQYKIPIQIENEDVIVLGLSLRQLVIIMIWGGIAYGLFRFAEPRIGAQPALIVAIPFVVIGLIVALMKISEMTFLPVTLNYFRLLLNSKERRWSQ